VLDSLRLRYDPHIVDIGTPATTPPLESSTGLIERIWEAIQIRIWPKPDEPADAEARILLQPSPSPVRYGFNDYFWNPDLTERSYTAYPAYYKLYTERVLDAQRYPISLTPSPETSLPRYLTGALEEPVQQIDQEGAVQAAANGWLKANEQILAIEADRGLSSLRDRRVVRFGRPGRQRSIESELASVTYQQYHNDVPIFGGALTLVLVRNNPHISVTNALLPLPTDAAQQLLPPANMDKARTDAIQSAKRFLAADDEYRGIGAVALYFHLLKPWLDGERAEDSWGEEQMLLSKKILSALTGGEITRRLGAQIQQVMADGEALRARAGIGETIVSLRELRRRWRDASLPRWEDKAQIDIAPYRDSELIVLPFADSVYLAFRIFVTSPLGYDTWQLFIDAHTGDILGQAEPLAAHIRFFDTSAAIAAGQPPVDDAGRSVADLEPRLARFCPRVMQHGGNPQSLAQVAAVSANLETEAVSVAEHASRLYDYFVGECGVSDTDLQPRGDTGSPNHALPLTLVLGREDPALSIAFDPATAGLVFQSDTHPLGIRERNRRIVQPSLDPEIIYHELAHAFMWRLNPEPFELHQTSAPFSRALVEGSATYLARSFARHQAEQNAAIAGVALAAAAANDDSYLWAQGAYRKNFQEQGGQNAGWGTDWSIFRSQSIVSEDLLALPNFYPSSHTHGLDIYYVGMVWARALWEIRGVLGSVKTDSHLLATFPALVGWAINFEVAAENLLDSLRRDGDIPLADLQEIEAIFRRRNLATGGNVRGLAITTGAGSSLFAGGSFGLLRSRDGGATWQPVALPAPALANGRVTALAANGSQLFAAAAGRVFVFDGANWQVVANQPEKQLPLSLRHTGRCLWVGTTSAIWEFSQGVWTDHSHSPLARHSIVGVTGFSATDPGGVAQPGVALLGLKEEEDAFYAGENGPEWRSLGDVVQNGAIGRILCLVAAGDRIFAGTLHQGVWQQQIAHNGQRHTRGFWQPLAPAIVPSGSAVLSLSFHNGALFVGTTQGLFVFDPAQNPIWQPLPLDDGGHPVPDPIVMAIETSDNHLLVGTASNGVWTRPRNGGPWLRHMSM